MNSHESAIVLFIINMILIHSSHSSSKIERESEAEARIDNADKRMIPCPGSVEFDGFGEGGVLPRRVWERRFCAGN